MSRQLRAAAGRPGMTGMPGARVPAAIHNAPQAHAPGSMPAPGCAAASSGPSLPPAEGWSCSLDGNAICSDQGWLVGGALAPTSAHLEIAQRSAPLALLACSVSTPGRSLSHTVSLCPHPASWAKTRPAVHNTVKPGFFSPKTSQSNQPQTTALSLRQAQPALRSARAHFERARGDKQAAARARCRARTWAAARRPQTNY